MAFVHCRECGREIKADTKQTRCENCGTFFPFTCAVCDKFLRPPFAVYDDERYVTDDHRPLCQDHYQRQCPECKEWFQADENPGYFFCLNCARARQERQNAAAASAQKSAKGAKPARSKNKSKSRPATDADHKPDPKLLKPGDVVVFALIVGALIFGIMLMLLRGG